MRAVDGVSFAIPPRGTLGLVGESGSGKSVTALSIMRLVASPPGRIAGGEIRYAGKDLLKLAPEQMRAIRGDRIAMIFQEPMTSLNPVFTVGDQVGEAVRLHQHKSKAEARNVAIEMFRLVGIPSPDERVDAYPHQLSGGMRQRVMIALALACKPDLLIADEPTTALDVTVQAQILDLLAREQQRRHMAMILITHDLGVVAKMAHRICVMYAGELVEVADREEFFTRPQHPYTQALFAALPEVSRRGMALTTIPGQVPSLAAMPAGCRFADRCSHVMPVCRETSPDWRGVGASHTLRCHWTGSTAAVA
ncbi:MAG: ABC transporter ATP-binding protein, partial [Acidobacteriota bacterium]